MTMTREQTVFIDSFFEALFWSEGEEFQELDSTDLPVAERAEMVNDCLGFLAEASTLLARTAMTFESAGHNFLLTRNGHGAGFWDRGLGDIGDKLTGMAHNYGTIGLELGNNGRVYVHH
jgi:hypothetical protein